MGMIKKFFRTLIVFGLPALLTFGVWVLLDPATFWQTFVTIIVGTIMYVVWFFALTFLLDKEL